MNWPGNCNVAIIGCHQKPRNSFHLQFDLIWHSFCSLFNSIHPMFMLVKLLWPSMNPTHPNSTFTFFPHLYHQDLSSVQSFAPAAYSQNAWMPHPRCVRWPAQPLWQTRPRLNGIWFTPQGSMEHFERKGPGGHLEVVCKSYVSGDFADLVGQKAVRVTCFHRNEWQRDISCWQ